MGRFSFTVNGNAVIIGSSGLMSSIRVLVYSLILVSMVWGYNEPTSARRLDDGPPPFAVPVPTMPSVEGPTAGGMPTVEGSPTVGGMPTVEGSPTVGGTPTGNTPAASTGPTQNVVTPTGGVPTVIIVTPGTPTEKPNKVSIPTFEPSTFWYPRLRSSVALFPYHNFPLLSFPPLI
jgi:hypothetical protein